MKFKEIDIDWYSPYKPIAVEESVLSESLSRDEAIALDIGDKAKERWATLLWRTNCVTTMVERIMEPIPTDCIRRAIICCVDSTREEGVVLGHDGICTVFLRYDPWPIMELGDLGRKEMTADIILRGMDVLERETGLDASEVRRACALAREAGFESRWVWRRRRSPSGMTAEVEVDQDTERLRIWMTVYSRRGQMLRRALMVEREPDSWGLRYRHLGDLRWEGDTAVVEAESGFRYELDMSL